jgi:hypothetical protein
MRRVEGRRSCKDDGDVRWDGRSCDCADGLD